MADRPDRVGLYAGTFDPPTNGHLDLIVRASRLVDRLVIAVAASAGKSPLFDHAERLELVGTEVARISDRLDAEIEVLGFDGLLVEFARTHGVRTFFRGLRTVADFDYEVQMFAMNSKLDPGIETVFLVATEANRAIASRLVKEVARFGGDISSFVPSHTLERTLARLG